MTKKKPPEAKRKKGRPKGSKAPGSRPDLKTKQVEPPPGSPETKPVEMVLEMPPDMTIMQAALQLKKEAFLKAFAVQGTKYHAAQTVNVSRPTVDRWLKEDPEFRTAFNEALEDSMDMVEHAGRVRAVAGVTRTIYYKDKPIGTRTEYSDVMTIVLLKAYRPEKFRERYEISGAGGGPIEVSNPIQRLQAKLEEIKTRSIGLLPGQPTEGAGQQIDSSPAGASPGEDQKGNPK